MKTARDQTFNKQADTFCSSDAVLSLTVLVVHARKLLSVISQALVEFLASN